MDAAVAGGLRVLRTALGRKASGVLEILTPLLGGGWVFRGVQDIDHLLTPSVVRIDDPRQSRVRDLLQEEGLMRNFRKYGLDGTSARLTSYWEWLSLAQHYRVKTRLMDWTWSLPTALAFSVWNHDGSEPEQDRDGRIWCANFVEINASNHAKVAGLTMGDYVNAPGQFGPLVYHIDKLREFENRYRHRAGRGRESEERAALRRHGTHDAFWLDFLSGSGAFERDPATLFFEPPSFDARFIAQSALFCVSSGKEQDLEKRARPIGEVVHYPEPVSERAVLYSIRVPAETKPMWRQLLRTNHVSWRTLFPDREGLAAYLNTLLKSKNFWAFDRTPVTRGARRGRRGARR